MKKILTVSVLLTLIGCFETSNKHQTDSEIIQKTDNSNLQIMEPPAIIDGEQIKYWGEVLRQELLYSLIDLSDSIYITDRSQLEKIEGKDCFNKVVTFNYTSKELDKIEIRIEKGYFDPTKHKLHIVDTVYKNIHGERRVDNLKVLNIIDGRNSYGIDGNIPNNEIKSLAIKWNGKPISIPDTVFANLYEPLICKEATTIEAYISDDKNIYLYMDCSDGAGGYSVKFVFDKQKYLTRIVTANEMTIGFDFLDGTAKVD